MLTDASKKLQADEVRENLWPIKFIHLFPEFQDDPAAGGPCPCEEWTNGYEWNMTRHVRSDDLIDSRSILDVMLISVRILSKCQILPDLRMIVFKIFAGFRNGAPLCVLWRCDDLQTSRKTHTWASRSVHRWYIVGIAMS